MPTPGLRRHSPAAERNRGPILAQLQRLLPPHGRALEIASGTGQHAAHFAAGLPGWHWQPSDADDASLESIGAWCAGCANVAPPLRLDVLRDPPRRGDPFDLLFCANMVHIAPWASTAALMRHTAACLAPGGQLILYGPYFVNGETPGAGNVSFDLDLRSRNPAWGLRRLEAVLDEARTIGLELRQRIDMPADNLMLVLSADQRRQAAATT